MSVIKREERNWKLFGQDKWGPQTPQSRWFPPFLFGHARPRPPGPLGCCPSRAYIRVHAPLVGPTSGPPPRADAKLPSVRRRDRGRREGHAVPCPPSGSRKSRQRTDKRARRITGADQSHTSLDDPINPRPGCTSLDGKSFQKPARQPSSWRVQLTSVWESCRKNTRSPIIPPDVQESSDPD